MKKDLKTKLKSSALLALIGTKLLTGINDKDYNEVLFNKENPHVSYTSKQRKEFTFSYILKSILMLPLWIIGSIILKLLEPLKNFMLSFLFTFIFLCLIVYIISKLLFPNLKFKDIFTKRNILIILISSLLINLARIILPLINKDLLKYSLIIYLLLGLICLLIIMLPLIKLARQVRILKKEY